jgi:DNA-binding transcriptional ArsR family regulator
MRQPYHPNMDQLDLPVVLNALADPVRIGIVKMLAEKKEATCACCNTGMPKSAISHHFKVLRESGVIYVRVEGKQRFLSLRTEELNARFPQLLDAVLKNI